MLGTSMELHRAANATHRWQQSDNGAPLPPMNARVCKSLGVDAM